MVQVSFKDHFSHLASRYSTFRPGYPEPLFDYLAGLCRRHDSAWDCACGGGQATVGLARRFASVLGTDASAQQIAKATQLPRVTYRVAAAESSGLEAESVDLVTVAQALHWLDLPPFYAEVRRVLRESAVLAVWTYGIVQVEAQRINELIQEFYSQTVGPYWPPERPIVEQGYRTLAFPFTELQPPSFTMRASWDRQHLLGYLRTWSATGRYVEHVGVDPVIALEEQVAPLWPQAQSQREISWPLALRVGRRPC